MSDFIYTDKSGRVTYDMTTGEVELDGDYIFEMYKKQDRIANYVAEQASTIKRLEAQLDDRSGWVSVQAKLPEYGEPVLLFANGVAQSITWSLDGADDTPDWFEPHHFDHEDSLKMWWNDATHWMHVNSLPSPPEDRS